MLSKLKSALSLTEYEARTYLALVIHGAMTVGELSKLSGVPRAKCYEVVSNLVHKGLIVMVSSRPAKYAPLPPEEGISNRVEQIRRELERRILEAKELMDEIRRLSGGEPVREAHMMIIESHEAILSNSVKDAANAKKEVLIALSRNPARIDWSRYAEDLMACIGRGVRFRFLVPSLDVFTSTSMEVLENCSINANLEDLVEVRESEDVKMPFVVIDGEITYLYVTDPDTNTLRTAVRIRDRRMAEQMREIFNRYWEGVRPP